MKTRRMRIKQLVICEAKPKWTRSELIFSDFRNNEKIEAVITIEDPYELLCVRDKLDEILTYWKKRLEP